MSSWNLIISLLCLALGTVMVLRERRRSNRQRVWARWVASLLAMAGLCGLGFKLKNPVPEEAGSDTAKNISVKSPPQKRNGFQDIHWDPVLRSGQPLNVQGTYMNSNVDAVTIYLNGFNTKLDSVKIPSGKFQAFTLHTIPKQTGKAVFQIVVNDRKSMLESEPLPLVIQQPDSLNMLILSSYPDFENKFLNQWLTGNRIQVVQRTRISRNRFEKNFLNRRAFDFNLINDALLKQFDLLICDASALASLSIAEQTAVHRQVYEKGMGLLVRTDSVRDKKTFYSELFPCFHFSVKMQQQRLLYTTDSTEAMLYPGDKDLAGIRFQPGTRPLVRDKEGRIFVSSKLEGSGKIIFSTLNNTFEWSLGGQASDYGAFWTYLIHASAKRKIEQPSLWSAEQFPRKDKPVHFILETKEEREPEPTVGKEPFYLIQGKSRSSQWKGTYWPHQAGWQPAVHVQNAYYEWYVFEPNDWPGFSVVEKPDLSVKREADTKNNPLFFLIIFMSGWAFLWLERKLSLI